MCLIQQFVQLLKEETGNANFGLSFGHFHGFSFVIGPPDFQASQVRAEAQVN